MEQVSTMGIDLAKRSFQVPETLGKPGVKPERVQIGALVSSKARLAYDLVNRLYGVSATETINVAPLLFVLLAESSLTWRRKKLNEMMDSFNQAEEVAKNSTHVFIEDATGRAWEYIDQERSSVEGGDIFGRHTRDKFLEEPRLEDANPFTNYLHKLVGELRGSEIKGKNKVESAVNVSRDESAAFSKFPDYAICSDEVDTISNNSPNARRALEMGQVRLADIPEELMTNDKAAERAVWLEEKLPDVFRDLEEGSPVAGFADFVATATPGEIEKFHNELTSSSDEEKSGGVDK